MYSGSAAFKAAAIAAVLALLVLPSFGRCPSLGPAPSPPAPVTPPAPAPVPAPAPGPVSCRDCYVPFVPACSSKCEASLAAACSDVCDTRSCDECQSKASNCTACCNDGTCSCDCKTNSDYNCRGGCYALYRNCPDCKQRAMGQCMGDCLSGPCKGCRQA
ncbi:unnamed protein product [Alopecurus aequalis]